MVLKTQKCLGMILWFRLSDEKAPTNHKLLTQFLFGFADVLSFKLEGEGFERILRHEEPIRACKQRPHTCRQNKLRNLVVYRQEQYNC